MIRFFLSLIIANFFSVSCNSLLAQQPDDKKYLASRDSILKITEFGSVYITRDKSSKLYNWLAPTEFDSSEMKNVLDNAFMQEILENGKMTLQHVKNTGLQGDWCSLYAFEGKLYVHSPSDWMFNQRVLITDSAFIEVCCADYNLHLIAAYKMKNSHKHHFVLSDYFGTKEVLEIEFLDPEQTVAIWKFRYEGQVRSVLKVRATAARNYDMIVNDCCEQKCVQEFAFDPPDFEALRKEFAGAKN